MAGYAIVWQRMTLLSFKSAGLLITCEHGGNRIPHEYARLFQSGRSLLKSHQGYDAGAIEMARYLGNIFPAKTITSTVSRLLIDLNRSLHHRRVFSEITKNLSAEEKHIIIGRYYQPHRQNVIDSINAFVKSGRPVVHIAVHSFVPILNGKRRNADIGLLYDPARQHERTICTNIKDHIRREHVAFRVRCNYPYRGIDDGLTTALRRQFSRNKYAGIELEINQRFFTGRMIQELRDLKKVLVNAIGEALTNG